MNLEKQNKKSLKYLRPEVIPLLVLIKHWSRSGQSSLIKTNEILLLLDVLHLTLTKSHKEFTLESLIKQVQEVMGLEAKNTFIQNFQSIATDSCQLLILFKGLAQLIKKPKEETSVTPLIDSNNGVLGLFLRRCCQEFERLTFSQVILFHRQWKELMNDKSFINITLHIKEKSNKEKLSEAKKERNFTSALQVLAYSEHNISVELKALHLAMLLAHFDHIDESSKALQEAIRLAQLNKNELVLEHSLALLKRLQPITPLTGHLLMEQFVRNAGAHQELFVSTGKLQLAQLDVLLNVEPKKVLSSIMLSQYDVFNSNEDCVHKIAIRNSSLLLLAATFCQYNLNPLSYMTLQLICHMLPTNQEHTPHYISDLSRAIQMMARLLYDHGHLALAISLLEASIKKLSNYDTTGRITQSLKCGLADSHIEEGLLSRNWSKVNENITKMRVYDDLLASYWSVSLLYHREHYKLADTEIQKLLSKLKVKQPSVEVHSLTIKLQLLLADIYYSEQNYSAAISVLVNVLTQCIKHHLLYLLICTKLKLAQCQLGLLLLDQCKQTLDEILPDIMRNGHCILKAQSYLLLAQITVTVPKLSNNCIDFQGKPNHTILWYIGADCQKALKYLEYALSELGQPQFTRSLLMKRILMLQGVLCHQIGDVNGLSNTIKLINH